jgi:hypothetical protein
MSLPPEQTPDLNPPTLVALLGYGGLIPFIALALANMALPSASAQWSHWLLAYGAVILSFVGALHWAFAMTLKDLGLKARGQRFVWSVVPALIGFAALVLPVPLGFTLLVVGFALAYWQDALLANQVMLAPWYPRLRARLSVVASICLLTGLV